jgi:hypothetical protein
MENVRQQEITENSLQHQSPSPLCLTMHEGSGIFIRRVLFQKPVLVSRLNHGMKREFR